MGRPKKAKSEKAVSVGLRFPPDLLADVDEEIARMTKELGVKLNRSQAVMALVRLGVEARRAKNRQPD